MNAIPKRVCIVKINAVLTALSLIFCIASAAISPLWGQEPSAANEIHFNPESECKTYNRMIFGQFIEHFHRQVYGGIFEPGSPLSDKDGFRTDVIAAMRELKVPIVRWPGGCFVSSYHWLDGVGPNRQPAYDKAWHVEDPNTFGTVEFVKLCRLIGAEPYICTNAGTGTEEEMSDWVEYCNLNIGKFGRMRQKHGCPEPLNVRYWSIGNENWGGHEMGAKTIPQWGPFVRESAKLMLNTDPDIKLFAAALPDENWTLPLLQTAGHLLNYVSIHGYWDWMTHHNNPSSYMACMVRTGAPENDILRTINILDRTGNRGRVGIAFDEWNLRGWHHPGHGSPVMDVAARDKNDINSVYTMADALFSACFLNTCLRHCEDVKIACFSPVVNTRGALFVHKNGVVKRTTYHVFYLYANKLKEQVAPIEIRCRNIECGEERTPILDAILTCNPEKTQFAMAIVNKSPDTVEKLTICGGSSSNGVLPVKDGTISALVLQGSSPDDYNDIGAENRVVPETRNLKVVDSAVKIPPHSLVIIQWEK